MHICGCIYNRLTGDSLKGAVVYYDGQMDDARMCVSIASTAAYSGACMANYVQVTKLLFDSEKRAVGATVKCVVTGETVCIYTYVCMCVCLYVCASYKVIV